MSKESCTSGELDSKLELGLRRKLEEDFTNASKEKMQVFLRIRPFKEEELVNEGNQHCINIEDKQTVLLRPPLDPNVGKNLRDSMRIHQRFTFSSVFGPEIEQKEFFEFAVLPTVKDSLKGETCLIFAYGATNSGKSYTIQGTGMHPGIIPRSLAVIFESTKTSRENALDTTETDEMAKAAFRDGTRHSFDDYPHAKPTRLTETNASNELFEDSDDCLLNLTLDSSKMEDLLSESVREECDDIISIWVTFAEIYNEYIYDLLEPVTSGHKRRNLKLGLNRQGGGNHIKGLRYVSVNSVVEACRMLQIGKTNLHIASTKLNQHSSRSHCIFGVHMIRRKNPGQPEVNSLTFCDLAGLERVAKTQNTGSRLKEAGNINTSLLVLGRCIEAIREKLVVPFRDSKLTRLFQGYLTENGKASMIVNVAQSSEMFTDTLNVMKFSASAKQIVSVDHLDRSRLWLNDQSTAINSSRITELWPVARQRWSEFSKNRAMSKASIATVQEEVLEESAEETFQEDPSDIQELIDIIWKLEKKISDITKEKSRMELEIRREVCQEFDEIMEDMNRRHNETLKTAEERNKEITERRVSLVRKTLIAKYEREYEDETFETTGDEESVQCSASIDDSQDVTRDFEDASASVSASPKEPEEMGPEDRRVMEREREALLQDLQRLRKEKEDLVVERKVMQQDANKMKNENSHLEKEYQSLVKESEVLQRENEQLLKKNSTATKDFSALEKRYETSMKANQALELEVASLQKVYDPMIEEKVEMEKKLKKMRTEEEELRKRVASMEKNVSSLQEICEKKDATIEKKDATIERLRLERQCLNEGNASLVKIHKRETDNLNDQINKLGDKIVSLEAELKNVKTEMDDFKRPKKVNTRGRKRAKVDENVVPKTRKLEAPEQPPPSQQVGIRSPLLAIGEAIRQSPSFKAVGAAVSRVIDRFTGSPATVPQRRTRRKLYNAESSSDLKSEATTVTESLPKETVATKRPSRTLRKKK